LLQASRKARLAAKIKALERENRSCHQRKLACRNCGRR
jgi:hypothetical protein